MKDYYKKTGIKTPKYKELVEKKGFDYSKRFDYSSPVEKKSPTKRSGFKMKSSPAKIYNKKGKRRKNYKY